MTVPMFQGRLAIVLTALIAAPTVSPDGDQAVQPIRLDVTGTKRYVPTAIAKVSGLVIGKPVTVAEVDAAAQRMADTGLFANVSYKYVTSGTGMTVTFAIEEPAWTIPVVFDNFVWSSDAQVIAALEEYVPSFDGTAPTTTGISAFIAQALE